MTDKKFIPEWRESVPIEGSYRSIFKWGDPAGYKHPNDKLFEEMKAVFGLSDSDFRQRIKEGDEQVKHGRKSALSDADIRQFEKIAGKENVSVSDYDRVKYSNGKTLEEAIDLRNRNNGRVTDLVIHPRDKKDVSAAVKYCNLKKIPLYVYGGGSSVNLGFRPEKGGVTLVMNTHMNKLLELNETDQTARVQAGILGPAYEDLLNNAPEKLGAGKRYTCGHFPQSFEYSSAGGWVVTLGSGQQSSYYGDAYDIVLSQEYVTPAGNFKTLDYPATATGPKINDIMKGSEGAFGVLVELTLKIFRHMPENRERFGFVFPSWEAAVEASREISQGEFGFPAVFRISDEEETHIGLKLYGIDGNILDKLMIMRGFKPMQRCLFVGSSDGDRSFTANVKKNVKKICRKHGAMYLTGYATKKWEPGRYKDPYLREDLLDYGVQIDTLESGVTWSNLHRLHRGVREFIKKRPGTICMTHASHFYPQGTNLYFIFILKEDSKSEFVRFQKGIIDAIEKNGGSLSHHHGVGRMMGPWMEKHLGREQMSALRALKKHFDPNNIMNPGGVLGIDK